jgi:hypothetical protein
VSLTGHNAFASKASDAAVQGSLAPDIQHIFSQPAYVNKFNRFVTFEGGPTTATASARAEGGFLMENGGHKYGAYFGRLSDTQPTFRGTTFQAQENPINLYWGQGAFGLGLSHSASENLTGNIKQTSLGVNAGYLVGDGEIALGFENGTAEKLNADNVNTDTFKMKSPYISASYLHKFDKIWAKASYGMGEGEQVVAAVTTATKYSTMQLSVMHQATESLYYGLQYNATNKEQTTAGTAKKHDTTNLPFYIGFEKDAASWITLRASLLQNVIVGSDKDDIMLVKEKKNPHNTKVAAGAGLKFNGMVIDGLFTAASEANGKLNTADLMTNVSLTYWF